MFLKSMQKLKKSLQKLMPKYDELWLVRREFDSFQHQVLYSTGSKSLKHKTRD